MLALCSYSTALFACVALMGRHPTDMHMLITQLMIPSQYTKDSSAKLKQKMLPVAMAISAMHDNGNGDACMEMAMAI